MFRKLQISMNIDIVDVDPIDAILHKFYIHPSILRKVTAVSKMVQE